MQLPPLVESYLEFLSVQKRYSSRTQQLYGDAISRFYMYAYRDDGVGKGNLHLLNDMQCVETLTAQMLRGYAVSLVEGGCGARSANLHLSALRGYCRWLIYKGMLKDNPAEDDNDIPDDILNMFGDD